jgi:hypothetical protein
MNQIFARRADAVVIPYVPSISVRLFVGCGTATTLPVGRPPSASPNG